MSDPVRLLELGADDFEAKLLRAGRSDAMPARSRRQILAGIGIGGLLSASTVASGVRAAAKSWLAKASLGAAGALAVWAGVRATHPTPPPTPARAPVTAVSPQVTRAIPPVPAPAVEPVAAPEAASPEPPSPVRATPAVRAATPEHSEASLTLELAAVEQARQAFLAHDYSQSLRLLDDYVRRFPKRQLASEATVLRIEALAARGDRDAAARIGHDFLQSHPNGPYAKRVRSVIGDSSPSSH